MGERWFEGSVLRVLGVNEDLHQWYSENRAGVVFWMFWQGRKEGWSCRVINHFGQPGCCNVKELTEMQWQLVWMSEYIQVLTKDVGIVLDCFRVVPSLFLHAETTSLSTLILSHIYSGSFCLCIDWPCFNLLVWWHTAIITTHSGLICSVFPSLPLTFSSQRADEGCGHIKSSFPLPCTHPSPCFLLFPIDWISLLYYYIIDPPFQEKHRKRHEEIAFHSK